VAGSTTGPAVARAGPPQWWVLLAALGVTVVSVAPAFLVPALAVDLRADLHLSATGLGLLVASFQVAAGVASPLAGRAVERFGDRSGAAVSVLVVAAVLAGCAAARESWHLAAGLAVGGAVSALAQPAANAVLVRRVAADRQGLAFGVKQAAAPAAAVAAGAAVPVATLWLGWRLTFLLAGILSAAALALVGSFRPGAQAPTRRVEPLPPGRLPALVVLSVASALAAGAVVSMSAFLVPSAVERGVSPAAAGILLSVAGLAAIASRVAAGWRADRRTGRHLFAVARMMLAGSLVVAVIGAGPRWALAPAVLLAFPVAWGWNGLLQFAVAYYFPHRPAVASSVTQAGLFVGGGLGPVAAGFVADTAGFRAMWLVVAAGLATAGLLVIAGRRVLSASLRDYP
jgi:predicted MFS family arabinose efflux permease